MKLKYTDNKFILNTVTEDKNDIPPGSNLQNKNGFEFWTRMGFKVVKEVFSTIHPERKWEIKVMEKII